MNREHNRVSDHFNDIRGYSWGGIPQPCGTTASDIRDHAKAVYSPLVDDSVFVDRAADRTAISPVLAAQQVRSLFRIKQLEISVEKLEKEIHELREAFCDKSRRAEEESLTQDPSILEVVLATERLFGGPIKIETLCDPSDGETEMVMVTVQARNLSFDEIIDRQLEWDRRVLLAKPGYSGQIRLQVVPVT